MRKLPSLDGLRAFSIAFVLIAHCADTPHAFPLGWLDYVGEIGLFGVKIFFVISGFLITTLLLNERARSGAISLKNFYTRRILRIFPAFYTFLLVTFLLTRGGWLINQPRDFVHAATFTANLVGMSWNLLHIWSLSAEEQFYLIWPLALLLFGAKLPFRVAALLIVVPPLFAGFVIHDHARLAEAVSGLSAGCVLARLRPGLSTNAGYLRFLGAPQTLWIIAAVLFLLESLRRFWFYEMLAPVISIGIALVMDAVLSFPRSVAGRFLNLRAISYFGTLSYSVYLWQQIFLDRWAHHWFNIFPVNVLCAVACAWLSFHFVERPFLRLKSRFEPPRQGVSEPLSC